MRKIVAIAAAFAFGVAPSMAGTNFYLGVQGGGAWGDADKFFPDFGTKRVPIDVDGFVFGAHAGVDFDIGRFFLGGEVSISFTDVAGGNSTPGGVSCEPVLNNVFCRVTDVEGLTTVVGRLGYDFGAVRAYALGGYATAEVSTDAVDRDTNAVVIPDSHWHSGWAYGAGLDWQAEPEWTLGLEYKRIDFDAERHAQAYGAGNRHDQDLSLDIVQARISYSFGE